MGEAKLSAYLLGQSFGSRNVSNGDPDRRRWGYKGRKGGLRECLSSSQGEGERWRLRTKWLRGLGIKEDT